MSHNRDRDTILSNLCSLEHLIDRIWDDLGLVKVYTKKRGAHPDLADPICMRKGSTIEVLARERNAAVACSLVVKDVCSGIHRSLAANFRYALVWLINIPFHHTL